MSSDKIVREARCVNADENERLAGLWEEKAEQYNNQTRLQHIRLIAETFFFYQIR